MEDSTGDEAWRAIPGHPGYEVSNLGRVRSLPRVVVGVNGIQQPRGGKALRTWPEGPGYLYIRLGAGRRYLVHRLVLETFVGSAPVGMEALHRNGNASDARLVNLRWGTHSENAADAVRHGTNRMTRRTHCPRRHPLIKPNLVACVFRNHNERRTCLACKRAQDRIRGHVLKTGELLDLQTVSDSYYAHGQYAG